MHTSLVPEILSQEAGGKTDMAQMLRTRGQTEVRASQGQSQPDVGYFVHVGGIGVSEVSINNSKKSLLYR